MAATPSRWFRHLRPLRARKRDEESTAAGIYGLIVSSAVMAASSQDSAVKVASTVLVTLLIYWGAERYSRVVAARLHQGSTPRGQQLWVQLTTGWELVTASGVPLAVLLVLTALGVAVSRALSWAMGCSTVLLALAGWEMGRDGRLSTKERLASTAVAGVFGVAMTVLKMRLH